MPRLVYSNDPRKNRRHYRKKYNRNSKVIIHRGINTRRRKINKYAANSNLVMYAAPRQMPYAPRYRTRFTTCIVGNIAAGSASGRYFAKLNSAFLPFTGGGWPGVLTSVLTTLQPTGYSTIVNATMYNTVRVFASRITVEFLPQALTDTVEICITPSTNNGVPADVPNAMAQPYTKSMFMSSSKMNSPYGSAMSSFMAQYKFLGVRSQAIEDDLSGNYVHAYNGNPGDPLYWVVNWATPDAVAIATAVEYRVRIQHWVECYNNTTETMTEL